MSELTHQNSNTVIDMYEHIKTKENYDMLLASGMFWEFYPELTGDWGKDKEVILNS